MDINELESLASLDPRDKPLTSSKDYKDRRVNISQAIEINYYFLVSVILFRFMNLIHIPMLTR